MTALAGRILNVVLIVSGPDSLTSPSSGSAKSQPDMLMDQSALSNEGERPNLPTSPAVLFPQY